MQKNLIQEIPEDLLKNSSKILFLSHLAIGDFVYLQNYFKSFAIKYPNLKIDLLVDEGRGKSLLTRWSSKKSNYVLYDWLNSCKFFNKIYNKTSSWWDFKKTLLELKNNNYEIIVLISNLRQRKFIKLAHKICPKNFLIAGFKSGKQFFENQENTLHINNQNAKFFEKILNTKTNNQERIPFIDIPKDWILYGKLKFLHWGIRLDKQNLYQKNIFINFTAKNKKRCWTFEKVIELIGYFKRDDSFYNTNFIINVMPEQYKDFEKFLKNYSLQKIFLFTATKNFFQIPAVIKYCDLVISVETSIIHLAAALNIPVVALMRKKNPEWEPIDVKNCIVNVDRRTDWIKTINAQHVFSITKNFIIENF
ncbi:hypothetical protein K9L05_02895 [Candidatus Babeliales bacterium]|nr:hypothetical protein [Candidatus Babeliales bacterium]MCF7899570.1 hypothetical protein [Candidatus Babeliales bacterium]